MKFVYEFGKRTFVPFVGGWVACKVFDEAYDHSKELIFDKDMEKQVKIKKMELRIAENEKIIRDQQELMRVQRAYSEDLSQQTQRQYNHLMDLKDKTKY